MTARTPLIDCLASRKAALLETRKRDGTWVKTPVTVAVEDGRAYFRTWSTAGKAKRLRRCPDVRMASSNMRGEPKGPTMQGHARLLNGDADRHASLLIARRQRIVQGLLVPLAHKLLRYRTEHYEVDNLHD